MKKKKKIGDVCEIKFGKRIKRNEVEAESEYTGIKYPCYGGGDISFYMKEFNREGKNIIISRFGVSEKCVRIINGKFWLNDSGFTVHSNDEKKILTDYLGYYCYIVLQSKIFDISMGACQKNLQVDEFKNIEIPIPSLAIQETIVEQLDVLNSNIETCKKNVEEIRKIIKYYIDCQIKNEKAEEKTLGQISKIKYGGSKISKDEGEYPLYAGGVDFIKCINEYNVDKNTIIISRSGSAGYVNITFKKSFIANYGYYLDLQSEINAKYLYYYLKTYETVIRSLAKGTGQPNLNREDLKLVKVKIPSKDKQKKIVEYCDNLSNIITNIEQQIKNDKDLMKQIMNSYLNQK
ncbi:MAG TPA: restriction endonuclease subunit S [Chitinophagales bacterium]|nr:restriction endonuclease subunit S [Chitinophagales bacterium]